MKKAGAILIFLIVFVVVAQLVYVHAQETPGLESFQNDSLLSTAQTGTEKAQQFQEAQNKSDFLKAQWGEILAKNAFLGPIIKVIGMSSPVTNPLFKYTVGLEPSLTWLFTITLILFILFFAYLHALTAYLPFSKSTTLIMTVCTSIALGIMKVFVKITSGIISALTVITSTWWGQLIAIVAVIMIAIIAGILSRNLENVMKTTKEKNEKAKMEQNVKTIGQKQETQEIITKAYTDAEVGSV